MKVIFASILLMIFGTFSYSQELSKEDLLYMPLVKAGEEALKNMNYDSCMTYYQEAFKIRQTSTLSTLRNAACAYSAGNENYLAEQLKIAFDLSWGDSKGIYSNYSEFEYLYETSFDEMIKEMYLEYANEAGVDMALMAEFEGILFEDQRYRKEMNAVEKEYGWESPQMDSLWTLQNNADSLNTLRITQIMDKQGYPGKSLVGDNLASTAFLVIQHSNLETQIKYLPIITKAADEGEVKWRSVALLIDRVNLGQGKPQIYGSQVYRDKETEQFYFGRIAEPFKIDSIRASIGLGPIQSYADNWEFTWDPENHIKINDEMDAKKKKEDEK